MNKRLAWVFLFVGVVMALRGLLIDDVVLFGVGAFCAVIGFADTRSWLFGQQGDEGY